MEHSAHLELQIHPVDRQRMSDLGRFSRRHGKFRYCSCMLWRMVSAQFRQSTKDERVKALEDLVQQDIPVGMLAYSENEPIAWCSIAPRETCKALKRSRTLPNLGGAQVWSVVCFFVDSRFRRQGTSLELLHAAVDYARSHGAQIIEGYPAEPDSISYTFMGSLETFRKAGFRDETPPGESRRVMRYFVK